jgi:hypothetical protein
VNAEKSQKATLGKAKKAERALADANKEHAQREQAVAEHLHSISAAAESKHFAFNFYLSTSCCSVVFDDTCFFLSFYAGSTGISPSSLQSDDDPLMDAVNQLEVN